MKLSHMILLKVKKLLVVGKLMFYVTVIIDPNNSLFYTRVRSSRHFGLKVFCMWICDI